MKNLSNLRFLFYFDLNHMHQMG